MAAVVRKTRLPDQGNDFAYWQTQSYGARLMALDEIRQEYHRWKGNAESRIEKVVRIIKR